MSDSCNVAATILGYVPNEGVNYFLAIAFGICALVNLVTGVWKRTWIYSIMIGAGCAIECIGYVGRVIESTSPCNFTAFKIQAVCIIIGPTVLCISLYLTLAHLANTINPSLSRVPPKAFPLFFVTADISCLAIQAAGGIISVQAGSGASVRDRDLLSKGNKAIIAGICLQVTVLALFGLTVNDYIRRTKKWLKGDGAGSAALSLWTDQRFKTFMYALTGAWAFILLRSTYRIAEMAEGWGNYIMHDQPSFVVLESFMILLACVLLSAVPPGIYFPQMVRHKPKGTIAAADSLSSGGKA